MTKAGRDLILKAASQNRARLQKAREERNKNEVAFGSETTAEAPKDKNIFEIGGDLVKQAISNVQQGAGTLADISTQAGTVLNEIKRTPSNIAAEVTGDKELKNKLDLERLSEVETAKKIQETIRSQKDISGESLKGTSPADEAAMNISQGNGSLDDFTKVGLEGLHVGATATTFVNPLTGGSVLRDVVQNAAIGAIGGAAQAGVDNEDILSGAGQGALSGALLSGVGNIASKAFGKLGKRGNVIDNVADTTKKVDGLTETPAITKTVDYNKSIKELEDMQSGKFSDDLYDIVDTKGELVDPEFIKSATDKQVSILGKQRDDLASQIDMIESPIMRESAMKRVNELDDKISALKNGDTTALMEIGDSGVTKKLNVDKVRERFSTIQKDVTSDDYKQYKASIDSKKASMPTKSYDEISDDLDAIGADGVTPEAVTPRADYTTIDEVAGDAKMTTPVRVAADTLLNKARDIELQRSNLMTPFKAKKILDDATIEFNNRQAEIDIMPEPRRTVEMEKLQSDYEAAYNDIQSQLENDSAKVDELNTAEQEIIANKNQVLADANLIKDNNPTEFGEVDKEMNAKISQEVEQEARTAIFNRMAKADGVPDANNTSKKFANIEQVGDIKSPEVSKLTSDALEDTFVNENFDRLNASMTEKALTRTYTGSILSSSNAVLEDSFGVEGLDLYGQIIQGYADTNKANVFISDKLASIQKSFGGSKDMYSKAVDVLEGKNVDLTGLTEQQIDGINKLVEIRDLGTRLVKKAAYEEKKTSFNKRYDVGNIKYTSEEIGLLAERDGITIKEAAAKYSDITSFKKYDVEYIAGKYAENSTIDDYYPHMFDGNGKEKVYSDSEYVKSNGDVKFGNMLHRTSKGDTYSRDVIDVFANYFAGLNKKVYLEPVLQKLDDAKLVIKAADSEASPVFKWIDKYQAQLKYNKPDAIGKGINELVDKAIARKNPADPRIGQNHYRSVLSAQRQINSMASLGLSFRNGIQQFTQFGNSVGTFGAKDTISGAMSYLKKKMSPKLRADYENILESRGITNAGIAKEAYSDLFNTGVSGKFKNTGEKLGDVLMFMSQKMDEFARGSTYEASLLSHIREGIPKVKAERLATADAARLNFLTSKVDMPIALNGDTVRSLSQFMTFSYKQVEAFKRMGLKPIQDLKSGNYKLAAKDTGRFLQMLAFYGVAAEGMSLVAGIDKEDNIPFYGNIFGDSGIPKSPLISVLFGANENTPGLLEITKGLVAPEGSSDFEKEQYRNDMFTALTDSVIKNFIPAGSQLKKSYEGYESTNNGGVVSKDGKVRFIQNTDDASKLKATLFGKYSTEPGKEWIKNDFPSLSNKQSEILNKQKDTESKKKAYDFFSGLKSANTKGTVTPEIKEIMKTRPNRAQSMIEEHNSSVKKAVDSYVSKYGELSDYEQEYLKDNYYITVKNVENISED